LAAWGLRLAHTGGNDGHRPDIGGVIVRNPRKSAMLPVIDNYEALGWSDVVRDCAAEIADRMTGFLPRFTADQLRPGVTEGSHAGVSFRIEGSGPALLLLPLFLAPSQWAPAIPQLARHFTLV